MRRLWEKSRFLFVLAVAGVVVVGLGGTGAAVCKFAANCHLRHYNQLNQLADQSKGMASTLTAGFTEKTVAAGLDFPTDFTFLPGGTALVSNKDGLVSVVKDGRVLATPFIDLRADVSNEGYRGLIAVEADPDFATNGYVYLLYVRKPKGPATGPTIMRLIRVTAKGDTAAPGTTKVILGAAGVRSCQDLAPTSDCLPSDRDHDGGQIYFAADGTMFVSTGDGGGDDQKTEPVALRAQNPDFLGGKILRITRDGKGVPSNPFWNGNAEANRSKVWAYGFRNPFRLTLRPGSSTPFVGDVGVHSFEEIDVVKAGGNYGWPCYEGPVHNPVYAATPLCKSLYARGKSAVLPAAFMYPHTGSQSITGGTFYTGTSFPPAYRGAYFYGDWVKGWIRVLRFDAANRPVGSPKQFASKTPGPVAIKMGPGGGLYYLAINAQALRRIDYAP